MEVTALDELREARLLCVTPGKHSSPDYKKLWEQANAEREKAEEGRARAGVLTSMVVLPDREGAEEVEPRVT
jgi:hypothetical protein